jgi:hypothetical protein
MDIDHQNNTDIGVRDAGFELESELVCGGRLDEARTDYRDTQDTIHKLTSLRCADAVALYPLKPNPNYSLPEQTSPVVFAGRVEEFTREDIIEEHDSSISSSTYRQPNLNNGIDGDANGKVIGSKGQNANGEDLDLDTCIPKEVRGGQGQEQRSRRISIDDLITGPGSLSLSRIQSNSAISIPTSISPATPEDHQPFPYQPYIPGSIHSPVPLPLRPRSLFGSTARPISNRRPGPINTPRSRASSYLTSAARNEGVGLGINMLNSPSTPGDMHCRSNSPLGIGMGPAQSPGSMSSRRRKAPEWPEPKSSRSHSFNQSTSSTPRDMYQTLKTPAALRVPSTAQLLSRPGDVHSPMLIPGSASGVGPMRRGTPPSSAPPLSARIDTQSPQIPSTPRRVHLLDVPRAKVISTLNERAGKYWFDPASSDCRICEFISIIDFKVGLMKDVPIPPKKAGPLSPDGTGESSDTMTSTWPPAPDCPTRVEGITGEERNVVSTRYHYKSRRGSQPDQEELPVSHSLSPISPVWREE